MKLSITLISITLFLFSCTNSTSVHEKTTQELKDELKANEQIDYLKYLSTIATIKENITQEPDLFHHTKTDGYIINGKLKNTATLAEFKDIEFKIGFLSETDTEMETKEFTLYKFSKPNSTISFSLKIYPPERFKNFTINVTKATPSN